MLKCKLKLPQKTHLPFPPKLSSLVSGSEGKEAENAGGEDQGFESGKELETFLPNGLGLEAEFEVHSEIPRENFDSNVLERGASELYKNEMEAVHVDEKRSDMEYEVRMKTVFSPSFSHLIKVQ